MERVLFVLVHPADESIVTGGTIATLVDRGADVTVLTCTRGEDAELTAALAELGVTDHRWLGDANARWAGREPRRYAESAADGTRSPDALAAADPGEVAADIAAVIAAIAPDVVVSLGVRVGGADADRFAVHHAARTAADVFEVPFFAVQGDPPAPGSLRVDATPVLARKRAAMAAHRTRLTPSADGGFSLADGTPVPVTTVESFARVREVPPSFADSGLGTRIGSCAIALLLGVFSGGLLTVVHQAAIDVAGVPLPWGIIAAIGITITLLVGLRLVFGTRLVPAFAATGMIAAVVILSLQSNGDVLLVPGDPLWFVWIFAPVVVAIVVLAWPRSRPRRAGRIAPVRVEGQELP